MKGPLFYFLIAVLAMAPADSCSAGGGTDSYSFTPCADTAAAAGDAFTTATIDGDDWLIILQGADPEDVKVSAFDTVVMDYSADGSDSGAYSTENIAAIRGTGKQVLAYLSIGEAEAYRYYFDPLWLDGDQPGPGAPCWLNRTNPDWEGNYKVQYWSNAWQLIVLGYLDKIIDQGFDGVYLDIIDAFQYWSDGENGEGFALSEDAAAARMINLVKRIAHHARVERGKTDFLIVPQNGVNILDHDTGIDSLGPDDYKKTLSAIGIESLYYNETTPIAAGETAYRRAYLDQIRAPENNAKKVLVVDYLDTGSHNGTVSDWITTVTAAGYLPYAARSDRKLNTINTFAGQP